MPEPAWAHWSAAGAERPWTIGVEEEVMLLERDRWGVANLADAVVAQLPPELARSVGLETHACVLELRTAPHDSVAAAGAELARLRRSVAALLGRRLGLAAAAAGTHPLVTRAEVEVSAGVRYRGIAEATGVLARREPTMALHVHVAVPTGDGAIRALDGLRGDLPLLLALSANSPFWRGEDTGFASVRTPIFSMFPRTGIPRRYGTYERYVATVDPLLRSGALPDDGHLWWDARPRPHLGTLEVRIMDAQTRVLDAVALTALVRCMVRAHAEGAPQAASDEVLAENRFRAARDGMRATFVAAGGNRLQPARELLRRRLDDLAPVADELRCTPELILVHGLAAGTGAERQRAQAREAGLPDLPRRLASAFAGAGVASAPSRPLPRAGRPRFVTMSETTVTR
jgi:carboxylate-amine ligase